MALTKDQKTAQVKDIRSDLKRAKSLVWMQYRGLSVADISDLRRRMMEKDASMRVAKKTLFHIASKEEGYPEVSEESMEGPIAFIFSFEDEVSGAKVAFEFGKDHKEVRLLGGVMEGRVLSASDAEELAKLLSREDMLGKVVGMMQSPLSGFAIMCGSPLRSFVIAVGELAKKGGRCCKK